MKIKNIELSGKIVPIYGDDNFSKIGLKDDDGYIIDVISRFNEIATSYPKSGVQVTIHLSSEKMTKSEATLRLIETIYSGNVDAGYKTDSYYYSSYTYGTNYESTLTVGGHDLKSYLENNRNQYCILSINIKLG